MVEYLKPEIQEKVLRNLTNEGRIKGSKAEKNRIKKPVVGIKNNAFIGQWDSASDAEKALKAKGYKIIASNIRHCCRDKAKRKTAAGIEWYYEYDFEKWNNRIKRII